MKITFVVSSKPVDGLFYYSYEYCSLLNSLGISSQVLVICHRNFAKEDYLKTIKNKYIHCNNIIFDDYEPAVKDVFAVMGRSQITLSWQDFDQYKQNQQETLKKVFSSNVISVYSENHPTKYPLALEFYNPKSIIDLCDREVYPNGVGDHFEKTINFSIYKPFTNDIKFKHLFLGTNKEYYAAAEEVISQFPDHGILTYDADYVNINNNNIFVPVDNLMSMFETYVYTKKTFDPAPRIFQECKYFEKDVIYLRDRNIQDGGSVYWKRSIKEPDVTAIISSAEKLNGN